MTGAPVTVAAFHPPKPGFTRRWTSLARPLPNYLILGAQKAGTTSLHRYLELHPAVLPPHVKEVHFFDVQWSRGRRFYRSNFPSVLHHAARRLRRGQRTITGEASPYYLAHPQVPARVRETLPRVPMIVILRDPVERAHSHYLHNRRLGAEDCATFEEAIEREPQRLEGELERMRADDRYESFAHRHHSYLQRGRYAAQLRDWFAVFPREQFLILENNELAQDPQGAYQRTLDFLGIPQWRPAEFAHHNAADGATPLDPALRRRLTQWFEPHNRDLYQLLDRDYGWARP